jgi:hypothetical protein
MRKLAALLVLTSGTFAFAGVSVSAPANGARWFDGAVRGLGEFLLLKRRLRHGNLYRARRWYTQCKAPKLNTTLT